MHSFGRGSCSVEVRGVLPDSGPRAAQARTGGVSGMVGLAEDPARFALSCIATGPIQVTDTLRKSPKGERVFESSASIFFKETKVQRFLDEERSVVVYLAWSSKLIEGSPKNSTSTVPIMPWGGQGQAEAPRCATRFAPHPRTLRLQSRPRRRAGRYRRETPGPLPRRKTRAQPHHRD
jgi:hypothetical protein